ncbi:MAG: TIGR00159 family protein [Candidatus Rokuibacteriota bacterium]|jgi:diadenylate cyclase|nr:MAG: TIGR00159 family protein [Candidatus Rokubacteria bacterium]
MIPGALAAFRWRDAVDILVVAAVAYRVLVTFRGTRAVQMLTGVALLAGATVVARRLELYSTSWILGNLWSFWVIALIVLFQPELRRSLAEVGRGPLLQGVLGPARAQRTHVLDTVLKAAESLAARRIGALIVFERTTGLRHYAELGVGLDALVSPELLGSIFLPYSPLHDGAVFVQGNRVVAAGCFLPLSRNMQLGRELGTRHRAALGISEETDAAALVVSEETGRISVVSEGQIETPLDGETLRRRLGQLLGVGVPARETETLLGGLRRLLLRPEPK